MLEEKQRLAVQQEDIRRQQEILEVQTELEMAEAEERVYVEAEDREPQQQQGDGMEGSEPPTIEQIGCASQAS